MHRPPPQWNLLMEKTDFILIGASGHARVVMSVLEAQQQNVLAVFDSNPEIKTLDTIPNEVEYRADAHENAKAIIAIGDNQTRKKLALSLAHPPGLAIHPSAQCDRLSDVGLGTVVMHNAVIQRGSYIGQHCIINTKASVDHDCKIDDFVHIAPGATLCGNVRVGEGSLIGAGAIILPNIHIGKNVVVGAGAVVHKDIPDSALIMGVPGKQIN